MRKKNIKATCCKFVGHVAGSLPAGTAASPWFMKVLAKAQPVACAGKKHSIITCTPEFILAHVMSRGPALKRSRITGFPLAATVYLL